MDAFLFNVHVLVRKGVRSDFCCFQPCFVSLEMTPPQWCSLRDTHVYAVYSLGKVRDLRIPT